MLPMSRVCVQSLIGELISHKPGGTAKKNLKKQKQKNPGSSLTHHLFCTANELRKKKVVVTFFKKRDKQICDELKIIMI